MAIEPPERYRLVCPQTILDNVRQWISGRIGTRFRVSALLALHTIQDELTRRPAEWGDPFKRWPQLNMIVYHRIFFPFYVGYGINEEHRVVFVQVIHPIIDAHPWWDLF